MRWRLPTFQILGWKRVSEILVESCAYMDPVVYMYYAAAKRQAEGRATEESEADEQQLLRLIDGCRASATRWRQGPTERVDTLTDTFTQTLSDTP